MLNRKDLQWNCIYVQIVIIFDVCFCIAFINKLLCSFGLDIEFRIQDLSKILCWVGEWHSSRWCQKYIEVRGSPSAFGKKLEAEKLAIEIRENDVCKIWTGIFPRSSFIYGYVHSKVPGRKVHPQMKNMSLQKKKKQTWVYIDRHGKKFSGHSITF